MIYLSIFLFINLSILQEIYAEWVCDKCFSHKEVPLVKFKPQTQPSIHLSIHPSIHLFTSAPSFQPSLTCVFSRHAETPECGIVEFHLDSIFSYNCGHIKQLSANIHDLSANMTKIVQLEFQTPAFRGFCNPGIQPYSNSQPAFYPSVVFSQYTSNRFTVLNQ